MRTNVTPGFKKQNQVLHMYARISSNHTYGNKIVNIKNPVRVITIILSLLQNDHWVLNKNHTINAARRSVSHKPQASPGGTPT